MLKKHLFKVVCNSKNYIFRRTFKKYVDKNMLTMLFFDSLIDLFNVWVISSVGRAPALQAGCRRFKPVIAHYHSELSA
jgi:hypothetical protein